MPTATDTIRIERHVPNRGGKEQIHTYIHATGPSPSPAPHRSLGLGLLGMVRTRSRSTTRVHARQAARYARGCTERRTRDHSRRITRRVRRTDHAPIHDSVCTPRRFPCSLMTTYHHAACSPSGGGPRDTGMYGQGAPLDCAPPPWHECAAVHSSRASTRQACSSHSHARCGACGGVLSRQDSRPTTCTCGSLSLPRRGASARMRRRASLRREGGGGRESRAPRSARPDPTRAHPAASRVGPYGHRRTRAPRSSPVVSCHAAGGFSPLCARAAVRGQVGSMPLVPCALAMPAPDGPAPRPSEEDAVQNPPAVGRRRARGRRTAARKPAGRGRRRRAADLRTDGRASDAT